MPARNDTAARILDTAERLVQMRGFNAFSYADVASKLGVTTASLHYHFPGKAALGRALITRYAARFAQALEAIDRDIESAPDKLASYAGLYAAAMNGQRMCLCGMLAAEYRTLPRPMRDEVVVFFDDNEAWLERVLEQGHRAGTLRFHGPARDTARMIISSLEGAMLVGRPYGDPLRFKATAAALLAGLTPPAAEPETARESVRRR